MGTSGWSGFSQASTLKLLVLALVLAVAQAVDEPYPAHRRDSHRMEVRLGRQLGSRRRLGGDSKEEEEDLEKGDRVWKPPSKKAKFEKDTDEGTIVGYLKRKNEKGEEYKMAIVVWDTDEIDEQKLRAQWADTDTAVEERVRGELEVKLH